MQKTQELDKNILKALETLNENNPYATFLDKSTLSSIGEDDWIDTGSYILNGIISGKLKKGGVPKGRVTMFYGESQCLKSYLVQKTLANAQKRGMVPVIFDTENAIDPEGAARLGLDISKVKYIPTFSIEKCRNDIFKFLNAVKEAGLNGKFIIAIDSIGNLESQMEQNRMEMGTRARAIKSLLRTCTQLAAITNTPIIIVNHLYDNPGELHPSLVKTPVGGKSVTYMPSCSVQLMRKAVKTGTVKSDEENTTAFQRDYSGIIIRALTVKNRFVKQFLEGEMYISFNNGPDKYYGILDLAVQLNIIEQTGSTYVYKGEKMGYAKSFHNNIQFWENEIIPLIEKRIAVEWQYNSIDDAPYKEIEETPVEEPASGVVFLKQLIESTK